MSRQTMVLGTLLGLSILGNLWQFWSNTDLQVQVARLSVSAEAAPVAADLDADRSAARDPRRGAKGDKTERVATRRASKEARGPREATDPRNALGAEQQPGGDYARSSVLRDKIRDNLREGMLDAVALTAQERGWDEVLAADAAMLIEGSFLDQAAVREAIREGDLDFNDGRSEMVIIREAANDQLVELLGDAEHAELVRRIRGEQ